MEKRKFWKALKSGEFAKMVRESSKGQVVSSAKEIYNIMKPLFAQTMDVESMYGVFLNTKNRVIAIEKLSEGTINHTVIYPRELVKKVLSFGAAGIVLCHNHPSGDTEPSKQDNAFTVQVGVAMTSIGVAMHDHVIVGNGYHSMADSGFIETIRGRMDEVVAV